VKSGFDELEIGRYCFRSLRAKRSNLCMATVFVSVEIATSLVFLAMTGEQLLESMVANQAPLVYAIVEFTGRRKHKL